MHILVIEDDLAVSHSIQLMLGSVASTVHTTDLGEEGVELAKLNAYDIIFLDLNLPDRSGYEVLQFLRTANVNNANPDPVWLECHSRQGQRARLWGRRLRHQALPQR
jgi:DNA-binding response OmpR family regulator